MFFVLFAQLCLFFFHPAFSHSFSYLNQSYFIHLCQNAHSYMHIPPLWLPSSCLWFKKTALTVFKVAERCQTRKIKSVWQQLPTTPLSSPVKYQICLGSSKTHPLCFHCSAKLRSGRSQTRQPANTSIPALPGHAPYYFSQKSPSIRVLRWNSICNQK